MKTIWDKWSSEVPKCSARCSEPNDISHDVVGHPLISWPEMVRFWSEVVKYDIKMFSSMNWIQWCITLGVGWSGNPLDPHPPFHPCQNGLPQKMINISCQHKIHASFTIILVVLCISNLWNFHKNPRGSFPWCSLWVS